MPARECGTLLVTDAFLTFPAIAAIIFLASFVNREMNYHLIGICGTAMASLAGMLQARGHHVTGSDEHVYPPMSTMLASLGISVMPGY
ncbi:MAG TPA: Mur ligase domain-containing protein, partial [Pyrinomonadaceae bacterium]